MMVQFRLRGVGRLEKEAVTDAAGETKDLGDVTVKENE
jgi:hypothetical protein